jgi:hypothetical protein
MLKTKGLTALILEFSYIQPLIIDNHLKGPHVQVKLHSELFLEAFRFDPFPVTGRNAAAKSQAAVDQGPP